MGKLAGFRYREIIKRLKKLVLSFTDREPGRTKSGETLPRYATPRSLYERS